MKLCALILPFFGQPKNYFSFFLESIKNNPEFDLLLYTDINVDLYSLPSNVHVKKLTLEQFREKASLKFGFRICINSPHKICDYKPSYGFLFEEDIKDYDYWGYCDCDLIFGNLSPLREILKTYHYRKIFAAGHLTVYRNTFDNCRVFMEDFHSKSLYKIVFTHPQTFAFDEDGNEFNVHKMFLEKYPDAVYDNDLSFNVYTKNFNFHRCWFDPKTEDFTRDREWVSVYYHNGEISSVDKKGKEKRFIYCHLQMRKFPTPKLDYAGIIEISPKGFANRQAKKRRMYVSFEIQWLKAFVRKVIKFRKRNYFPVIDGIPTFSLE